MCAAASTALLYKAALVRHWHWRSENSGLYPTRGKKENKKKKNLRNNDAVLMGGDGPRAPPVGNPRDCSKTTLTTTVGSDNRRALDCDLPSFNECAEILEKKIYTMGFIRLCQSYPIIMYYIGFS